MATPKKANPQPSAAQVAQIRAGIQPTNMSLEEFESYQERFSELHQPASHRRGTVKNSELYGSEKRLGEEFIMRYIPAILQQQILIATGQAREYAINHKTGEVEEFPANPRTVAQTGQALMDRLWGKPETIKHETVEREERQTLTILVGPAADAYNEEQARIAAAKVVEMPGPDEPLVLPSPPPEELHALPAVYEKREIRKLALDVALSGGDDHEVRRAIHEEFGSRDARRAARKAFERSEGDTSP